MTQRKDTRTDLAKALRERPQSEARDMVIELAEAAEFHDFKNRRFDTPKVMLVQLLGDLGPEYDAIRQDVTDGVYDERPDAEDDAMLKRDWLANGGTEASWKAFMGRK